MGQALQSAAARLRTSKFPTQTTQHMKNVDSLKVDLSKEGNVSGVVEERDSTYDEMLNKMVGRITSKPGGKLEMGIHRREVQRTNAKSTKLEGGSQRQRKSCLLVP